MIKPKALRKMPAHKKKEFNLSTYSLVELKAACKEVGITNTVEYREQYKNHSGFPAHPERFFADEWISYYDFFDILDFISYQSLKSIIQPLNLKNAREYKKFIREQKDPTLPLQPSTVYVSEWENWYKFLGKSEPFKPEFISAEYQAWSIKITDFMKQAKGGGSKVTQLCCFIRLFY